MKILPLAHFFVVREEATYTLVAPQLRQWTTFELSLAELDRIGPDILKDAKLGDNLDRIEWSTTDRGGKVMIDRLEFAKTRRRRWKTNGP